MVSLPDGVKFDYMFSHNTGVWRTDERTDRHDTSCDSTVLAIRSIAR